MRKSELVHHSRRRAISTIIGGVLIFLAAFSIVLVYFGYELNIRATQNQASNQAFWLNQIADKELIGATAYPNALGVLVVNVTNWGQSTVVIDSVVVGNVTTNTVISTLSSLNVAISPLSWKLISTGVTYNDGAQYWFKVQTDTGRVAMALFPVPVNPNNNGGGTALNALAAEAIGDIYLIFPTFSWYFVTQGNGCTSTSTYCLQQPGRQAFSLFTNNATQIAYAVKVVNLNPLHLTITLDAFTSLLEFWGTGSSFRTAVWFILNNSTDTNIDSTYTPISLPFNVTTTIVFGTESICKAGNCYPPSKYAPNVLSGSNAPQLGLASTFIFAHGWKNIPQSQTPNYGQNLPFVTTVYHGQYTSVSCATSTSTTTSSLTTTTSTSFTTTSSTTTTTSTTTRTSTTTLTSTSSSPTQSSTTTSTQYTTSRSTTTSSTTSYGVTTTTSTAYTTSSTPTLTTSTKAARTTTLYSTTTIPTSTTTITTTTKTTTYPVTTSTSTTTITLGTTTITTTGYSYSTTTTTMTATTTITQTSTSSTTSTITLATTTITVSLSSPQTYTTTVTSCTTSTGTI